MRQVTVLIISIALMMFFTSCATSVYTLPEAEREGVTWVEYYNEYDDVYSASINVLQDDGYIIENTDRETGLIVTDWRQSESITQRILIGDSRIKYNINLREVSDNATRVTINLQRQTQGGFGGWEQQKVTRQNAEELLSPIFESISSRLN